jgi:hypothetical protein
MSAGTTELRAIGEPASSDQLISVRPSVLEELRRRATEGRDYSDVIAQLLWPPTPRSARVDSGKRGRDSPVPPRATPAKQRAERRSPCAKPGPNGWSCRLLAGHICMHRTWGRNGSHEWSRARS